MRDSDALRLITACLMPEAAGGLAERIASGTIEWTRIVSLASNHYVAPSLYPSLRQRGLIGHLPADVTAYLETIWELNRERNRRLRRQLVDLTRTLNAAGIVPMLLKGANVFLPGAWPGAGDRFLGDLDVQVPATRLPEAVAALQQQGYDSRAEPFAGSDPPHSHHRPPLVHPEHPGYVELHRELVGPGLAPLLPCIEIREQAQLLSLEGASVLQPVPFWRLLHLLLHTGVQDRHSRRRSLELRQANDWVQLRRILDANVDWQAMQRHLAAGGYSDLLPAYLSLVDSLFGQAPPMGIAINNRARRVARQTLVALDNRWRARWFRAEVCLQALPQRLTALPRKLVTPSWYAYRFRKWRSDRGQSIPIRK